MRNVAAAEALFGIGVTRVVIGTAAVENPSLVGELVEAGHQVVVGIDARNGFVATHGWTEPSDLTVTDLAARFAGVGVAGLVVTDISRDGTQEGPDVHGLEALVGASEIPVIASGGVGSLKHLKELAVVASASDKVRRLEGVIVGRALYEGSFRVGEAIAALADKK